MDYCQGKLRYFSEIIFARIYRFNVVCEKRYSEFRSLYDEISAIDKNFSHFMFPKKYFFHSDTACNQRKASFASLLDIAMRNSSLLPELYYFLSVSEVSVFKMASS
jgi:hypothetical protein